MGKKVELQRRIFEKLLRPHLEKLFRQAFWLTRDRQDAEDIVQDVLIKLYPRCDELLEIEMLGPWLARVLQRTFIDSYRKNKRRSLHLVTSDRPEDLGNPVSDAQEIGGETPADIMDIQAGLMRLNDDQRIVILMHDAEGYSLVDLEKILGAPIGTLKSRLHRGRAELRKFLTGTEPFSAAGRVKP